MVDLAVVIPTLDEEVALKALLGDLASQRGVNLSVTVADGGSRDATRAAFASAKEATPLPLLWVDAVRGRGAQMNAGARAGEGETLLFLHADTRLPYPGLLAEALRAFGGGGRRAGHFGLSFGAAEKDLFWRFYEAKTLTNRPGTVNGDQGLMIDRKFFEELGGFPEALPYLEDVEMERRIRSGGEMILLPGRVTTSARRFAAEGRGRRQTLNALVRLFEAAGRAQFAAQAPGLYREQAAARKLSLYPFFLAAHRAAFSGGIKMWLGFWYSAGGYARENAWQLTFALDCALEGGRTEETGKVRAGLTRALIPLFDFVTDNPLGKAASAVLTAAAFYGVMSLLAMKSREGF